MAGAENLDVQKNFQGETPAFFRTLPILPLAKIEPQHGFYWCLVSPFQPAECHVAPARAFYGDSYRRVFLGWTAQA